MPLLQESVLEHATLWRFFDASALPPGADYDQKEVLVEEVDHEEGGPLGAAPAAPNTRIRALYTTQSAMKACCESLNCTMEELCACIALLYERGMVVFPWKRLLMRDGANNDEVASPVHEQSPAADADSDAVADADEKREAASASSSSSSVSNPFSSDISEQFDHLRNSYAPIVSHVPLPLNAVSFVAGPRQKQRQYPRIRFSVGLSSWSHDLKQACPPHSSCQSLTNLEGPEDEDRPVTFVSPDSDYFRVDLLTDWFSECMRMSARRQDTEVSPRAWLSKSANVYRMLRDMSSREKWTGKISPNHPEPFRSQLEQCDITPYTMREELYSRVKEATGFKIAYAATLYRMFCTRTLLDHIRPGDKVLQSLFPRPLVPHYYEGQHVADLFQRVVCESTSVLDISAGWGDRLLAAMAVKVKSYTAADPNPALKLAHQAVIDRFAGEVEDPRRFSVFRKPFERISVDQLRRLCDGKRLEHDDDLVTRWSKFDEEGERASSSDAAHTRMFPFDMVFSSPPFFNFELYNEGDDAGQSHVSFPDEAGWLLGFLFASMSKCWSVLKMNGIMAIHIVDVYPQRVCLPMVLFVAGHLPGARYCGNFGSVSDESNKLRPCWVWEKLPYVRVHDKRKAADDLRRFMDTKNVSGTEFARRATDIAAQAGQTTGHLIECAMEAASSPPMPETSHKVETFLEELVVEQERPASTDRKACVVVLGWDADIAGVLQLARALRLQLEGGSSHTDLVCLVSSNVSGQLHPPLLHMFDRVLIVPSLCRSSPAAPYRTFAGLNALRLLDYRRVLLCPVGTSSVMQNIHAAFDAKAPAASLLARHLEAECFMLLRPSQTDFNLVVRKYSDRGRIIDEHLYAYGGDSSRQILWQFYKDDWSHLSSESAALFPEVKPWNCPEPRPTFQQWDDSVSALLEETPALAPYFPPLRAVQGTGVFFDVFETGDAPTGTVPHPAAVAPENRRRPHDGQGPNNGRHFKRQRTDW